MDIHHARTCHACGRVLKRHRSKRQHCSQPACRNRIQVMRTAREKSASAPLVTLAMSYRPERD